MCVGNRLKKKPVAHKVPGCLCLVCARNLQSKRHAIYSLEAKPLCCYHTEATHLWRLRPRSIQKQQQCSSSNSYGTAGCLISTLFQCGQSIHSRIFVLLHVHAYLSPVVARLLNLSVFSSLHPERLLVSLSGGDCRG